VQGDLVTERTHDVVAVCPETDDNGGATEGENPEGNRDFAGYFAGGPDEVDGGIGANGVGDIVGTVGEGGGGGSHDLQERVCVFGAVVVVLAGCVDLLYVAGEEILLALVVDDILVYTVEESVLGPPEGDRRGVPCTWGRLLLGNRQLVCGSGSDWMDGVDWGNVGVGAGASWLCIDGVDGTLLNVFGDVALAGALSFEFFGSEVASVEVADAASCYTLWARSGLGTAEKKRSHDDLPVLQLPVILDESAVQERNEDWMIVG
jgi:hypothetical protein